jgi:putative ABC transport system permease protein
MQLTLIRTLSLPYARSHGRLLSALVLTIALGVASVVASGALVSSGVASLHETTTPAITPDLTLTNGFAAIPEDLVQTVEAIAGVQQASGLLTRSATLLIDGHEVSSLLVGIDLLRLPGATADELRDLMSVVAADPTPFLTRTDAISISRTLAHRLGIQKEDTVVVRVGSQHHPLHVASLHERSGRLALDVPTLLMDLPAAQLLLNQNGLVDAIAVRLSPESDPELAERQIRARVDGQALVVADPIDLWRNLLFGVAFILELTGSVAIVAGALIIYHCASLVSSQRKLHLDLVRSLGVPRGELLRLLSQEALAIGIVATAMGSAGGMLLARWANALFRGTIEALYAPITIPAFRPSETHLAIAIVLGLFLPVLASAQPVLSGLRITGAVHVATPIRERERILRILLTLGIILLLLALLAGEMPRLRPPVAIAKAAAYLSGPLTFLALGLVTPVVLRALDRPLSRFLPRGRLLLPYLAWRALRSDPGRAATVVAAVLIGSGYAAVTLTGVHSLRASILRWLASSQPADLTVAASGYLGAVPSSPPMPSRVAERIRENPAVARVEPVRLLAQPYLDRWVVIVSKSPDLLPAPIPDWPERPHDQPFASAESTVITNEVFARLFDIAIGDRISLRSPSGLQRLRVAAVVQDYSGGDLPTAFFSPEAFRNHWHDDMATSFQLWLNAGFDIEQARQGLRSTLPNGRYSIWTQAEYRTRLASLIDSMFYSGYALELVGSVVMAIGIITFFTIMLHQREREFELLTEIGATRHQLLRLILWEAVFIGILGGALGCLSGLLVSHRFISNGVPFLIGVRPDLHVPFAELGLLILGAAGISVAASLPFALRVGRHAMIEDR